MKYTASFNEKVNDYLQNEVNEDIKELFMDIRETVIQSYPEIKEDIKWKNCLVYSLKKNIIQTVAAKKHITLIFFEGSKLTNKHGLLEGEENKKTRSLRITSSNFQPEALQELVLESVKLNKL